MLTPSSPPTLHCTRVRGRGHPACPRQVMMEVGQHVRACQLQQQLQGQGPWGGGGGGGGATPSAPPHGPGGAAPAQYTGSVLSYSLLQPAPAAAAGAAGGGVAGVASPLDVWPDGVASSGSSGRAPPGAGAGSGAAGRRFPSLDHQMAFQLLAAYVALLPSLRSSAVSHRGTVPPYCTVLLYCMGEHLCVRASACMAPCCAHARARAGLVCMCAPSLAACSGQRAAGGLALPCLFSSVVRLAGWVGCFRALGRHWRPALCTGGRGRGRPGAQRASPLLGSSSAGARLRIVVVVLCGPCAVVM